MDSWTLVQYNNVVDLFLDEHNISLDSDNDNLPVNLIHRLDSLLERGSNSRPPVSRILENGLYELRATVEDKEIRLIFFFMQPPDYKTLCFVHAFFKKTQKTSSNDKKIARTNRNIVENKGGKTYVFNFAN